MHKKEAVTFTNMCLLTRGEETGLRVEAPRLVGVKDWYDGDGRYVVLFYRAERFSGELRASEEGDVWWIPLADLPKLPLAPDMEDMLRVFLEEDLSEFYYRIEDGTWIRELK